MIVGTILPIIVVLWIVFAVVEYVLYWQEESVAQSLTLAERDFNNLVNSGLAHGGRKERVTERREWNTMADYPVIQINSDGYRSIAHDLVASNEKELGGKGAAMGKASITAFLLRELYEGNVDAAQSKIFVDTKNADGTPPYIAPGIYELVGFDKFNPVTGFPPGAGVDRWLLRRVVRKWHYPRDIRMIKTGQQEFHKPIEALNQLIQQNL